MFQRKINETYTKCICIELHADCRDHDKTAQGVLQRCRQVNLKLKKDKCHFRCRSVPFFGEIISWNGVQPDPRKIKALVEMSPPKNKELQAFLGIINYLGKFSPSTANICDPLQKLTSSRAVWMCNCLISGHVWKNKVINKG